MIPMKDKTLDADFTYHRSVWEALLAEGVRYTVFLNWSLMLPYTPHLEKKVDNY